MVEQACRSDVEIWNVRLSTHEPYAFTRLKRAFVSDDSRHCVVMVDAQKLLTCANRDTTDYVLPRVEDWYPWKVRGIREFLDPAQSRIPDMPYVTIRTRNRRTLLGLMGLDKEGVSCFPFIRFERNRICEPLGLQMLIPHSIVNSILQPDWHIILLEGTVHQVISKAQVDCVALGV